MGRKVTPKNIYYTGEDIESEDNTFSVGISGTTIPWQEMF